MPASVHLRNFRRRYYRILLRQEKKSPGFIRRVHERWIAFQKLFCNCKNYHEGPCPEDVNVQ